MAKLVQKSGYIKSGKAGGYMRYIATREGVEKLAGNGAVTKGQRELIPKGNFIVQKTGQHPMRTRLRLFLEWGITFEEPYIVPERADRAVAYANREDLEHNLPKSNKAEDVDVSGAYAVSGRGGMAHEPAVDKPRRRGGKQMKTYGEEDL